MSVKLLNVAMPTIFRAGGGSKYDFGSLTVGGPALVEDEVVNVEKVASRLHSALVAYRKRTGDTSKFSVRTFKNDAGQDCVGAWKVADAAVAAE